MKKLLPFNMVLAFLFVVSALPALAGDLETLSGKWSVKKTNEKGQPYRQILEFKKDKFVFKIVGEDDKVYLYAEGDVKLDKAGAFKTIRFFNIKGGQSKDEAEPVDDDRDFVYTLDSSTFAVAVNFDKDRDRGPSVDIYSRADK